jgi:primosomal replication protein N
MDLDTLLLIHVAKQDLHGVSAQAHRRTFIQGWAVEVVGFFATEKLALNYNKAVLQLRAER